MRDARSETGLDFRLSDEKEYYLKTAATEEGSYQARDFQYRIDK